MEGEFEVNRENTMGMWNDKVSLKFKRKPIPPVRFRELQTRIKKVRIFYLEIMSLVVFNFLKDFLKPSTKCVPLNVILSKITPHSKFFILLCHSTLYEEFCSQYFP